MWTTTSGHRRKHVVGAQICCTCTEALCYGRLAYFSCLDVGLVPSTFFTAGGGLALSFITAGGELALSFFTAGGGLALSFFTADRGLAFWLSSQLSLLIAGLYCLCCLMVSHLLPPPASPSSLVPLWQLVHVISWALMLIAIVHAAALWLMLNAVLLLLKLVAVIAL